MSSLLRVCRTESNRYAAVTASGASLYGFYSDLVSRLAGGLPETTVQMFAEPRLSADGGWIDWCTALPGQPEPLTGLAAAPRAKAEALVRERLATVRAFAGRQTDSVQADILRRAAVDPSPEQVFVINGQPVIVGWGQAGAFPAAPVAPAAAVAAAVAVEPVRRSFWRWLLPLLLLLALIALVLLFLKRCDGLPLPFGKDSAPVTDPQTPAEDNLDDLKARIRAAEEDIRRRLETCPAPTPPQTVPPKVDPIPEPVPQVEPAPTPQPQSVPEPKPKPEPKQPKPEPKPPVEAKPTPQPKPQAKVCPPERRPWEKPEVVLMVDGSGSMRLPQSMSDSQADSLISRAMRGDRAAQAQLFGYGGGQGSRLEAAKAAMSDVVKKMPQDVDLGLLVFGKCEGTDNHNFFSAPQRPKLLSQISKISPQRGTPLARGLQRAGNMVDGSTVPGIIVVVTDGDDSCGGDPCAVARALKQQKPNLKINVIGVGGSDKGRCMATATGGKFYTPRPGQPWDEMLMRATEQTAVPSQCR